MRIVFLILSLIFSLQALEVPVVEEKKDEIILKDNKQIRTFGENLFNGAFSKIAQHRYNPEYLLNIGDIINLKLWGAVDLEIKLVIDEQGNIFIPKVGTINLLGVKNKELSNKIKRVLKNTYRDNVYIYANLDNFQPVSIFVAGGAVKPGLYEGLSSDSILQFIDKAKGIDKNGSYRNITIVRDNKEILKIDLYEYLLNGKLDMMQFKTGDIINIEYLRSYITVDGDVQKPLKIETDAYLRLSTIIKLVQPYVEATDVVLSGFNTQNRKTLKMFPIQSNMKIEKNQHVKFVSNNNTNTIEVKIDGEHEGLRNILVEKGTTLEELLSQINYSALSSKNNINLYRKSVAKLQKELLDNSLNELEASVLKTGSSTTEESAIRQQDSQMILNFIQRAKEVEPRGRVILNKNSDFSKIVIEDEDTIYIPKKSHIVTVQGEVKIPAALSYVEDMSIEKYLALCGGLGDRADEDNILVIKQNGNVVTYNNDTFSSQDINIEPGDSVLVLAKLDSKNIPIVKSVTQIIYQIAVGVGVLVGL